MNTAAPSIAGTLSLAAALLAACAPTNRSPTSSPEATLSFTAPAPLFSTTVVLEEPTSDDAVARVAAQLRGAEFEVSSARRRVVRATSTDNRLVNCGEFTQRLDRDSATFAGNAPTAVIFNFGQAGDIMVRVVATRTEADVRIADGPPVVASLGQRHEITIRHLTADRSQVLWSQTRIFDGSSLVGFEDGTYCTSSDYLAATVR
jgi:hypothetical protein